MDRTKAVQGKEPPPQRSFTTIDDDPWVCFTRDNRLTNCVSVPAPTPAFIHPAVAYDDRSCFKIRAKPELRHLAGFARLLKCKSVFQKPRLAVSATKK